MAGRRAMPGKLCTSPQPTTARAPAELEIECAAQLRRIGDRLNNLMDCGSEILVVLADKPGKKAGKQSPAWAPASTCSLGRPGTAAPQCAKLPELEVECVTQLRRIGDKVNSRQKLMNLISNLFSLVT